MGMIDIHTHILPGVDDGSPRTAESLEMLRLAAASGVETVIATPHSNLPGVYANYNGEWLQASFDRLIRRAEEEEIPVRILCGMEVYATEDLPQLLEAGRVLTLNDSRYVLMEFDFHEQASWCTRMLESVLEAGYTPIVAHPERYYAVWQEPWCVYPWLEMGAHVQLTRGSILGKFGREAKRAADYLLQHNLVACIASDAHGSRNRIPEMDDILRYITAKYSPEYADMLLTENPAKICADMPLIQ